MDKISFNLQQEMNASGPASSRIFNIIVNMEKNSDWPEDLRLIIKAGLELEAQEEPIRFVSGKATAEIIEKIAAIPSVQLIELDEEVSIIS